MHLAGEEEEDYQHGNRTNTEELQQEDDIQDEEDEDGYVSDTGSQGSQGSQIIPFLGDDELLPSDEG